MGSLSRTVRQLEHVGLPQPHLCRHGSPPAVPLLWDLRDVRLPWLWLSHGPQPMVNYPTVGYPMAGTRNLIKFGNFLELNGLFEQVATATTTAPVTTVKGNSNIQQWNP